MVSIIEQICETKGLKMTVQRKIIAEVLSNAIDHPDVEELYARANALDPNISLATVYRTLGFFENNGIVKKLEIGDGKARYEAIQIDKEHHYHLIDVNNGNIIEFYDQEIITLKEKIAKKLGYKLLDHRFELYGIPIDKE